jgi:hypothetical protein
MLGVAGWMAEFLLNVLPTTVNKTIGFKKQFAQFINSRQD